MAPTQNPVKRTIRSGNSMYVYTLIPILIIGYGIFGVLTSEKPIVS
jgi:hypothetical protein